MDQLLINLTTRPRPLLLSSSRTGCRQLLTRPSRPPPLLRQFFLAGLLADRLGLGFNPRLCNRPGLCRRSWLANRLQWPRWRRASRGQVARQPQLLRKFLLLDSGAGLLRNLVRDRGLWLRFFGRSRFRMAFSSGNLAAGPLFFVDKTPEGAHQMGNRDVDTPFPENLCDPMHAEAATMRLQDLFLVFSQCVDLGLFPIAAAFGAPGDLKEILGSRFEMIRISQCESPDPLGVPCAFAREPMPTAGTDLKLV
jgi:hypothetical protein